MPVQVNATLTEVRQPGGTDQSEGTAAGAVLFTGPAGAYWRETARAVPTSGGGSGILASRTLFVDRALGIAWAVNQVVTFTRGGEPVTVRVLEVVGTQAPAGYPAEVDTVKLLCGPAA